MLMVLILGAGVETKLAMCAPASGADNEDANIFTIMMIMMMMMMMFLLMMMVVFGNQISNVCGLKPPHQLPPTLGCGFHHAHLGGHHDHHDYDDDDDDDDDVWIPNKKWEEEGELILPFTKRDFCNRQKNWTSSAQSKCKSGSKFF